MLYNVQVAHALCYINCKFNSICQSYMEAIKSIVGTSLMAIQRDVEQWGICKDCVDKLLLYASEYRHCMYTGALYIVVMCSTM